MSKLKNITIFGFADAKEEDQVWKDAFEVTKLLAENGYTIVNGGGPGVMKAATLGAHAGGGRAIGVSFYPKDAPLFEGRDKTNLIDEEIVTEHYIDRTMKLLDTGDAYVAFKGGTGTLSEFGMAWGLARLYFGHHKPFILFGNFWREMLDAFEKNMYIRGEELKVYRIADNPDKVLEELQKLDGEIGDQVVYQI